MKFLKDKFRRPFGPPGANSAEYPKELPKREPRSLKLERSDLWSEALLDLGKLALLGAAGIWVGWYFLDSDIQAIERGERLTARYEQQHKALAKALVDAHILQNKFERLSSDDPKLLKSRRQFGDKDKTDLPEAFKSVVPHLKLLHAESHLFHVSPWLHDNDKNQIHCMIQHLIGEVEKMGKDENYQIRTQKTDLLIHDLAVLYEEHTEAAFNDMSSEDVIDEYQPSAVLKRHPFVSQCVKTASE